MTRILFLSLLAIMGFFIGIEMANTPPRKKRQKRFWRFCGAIWGLGLIGVNYWEYQATHPVPDLPNIRIETLQGLPENVKWNPDLRYHQLSVRNGDMEIFDFCSRLQLPEPIADTIETEMPPGTTLAWRPLITGVSVKGIGNKTFVGPGSAVFALPSIPSFFPDGAHGELLKLAHPGDISGVWELTIDRLPAHGIVSLLFLTSREPRLASNYLQLTTMQFTNKGTVSATVQGTTNSSAIIHDVSAQVLLNWQTNYHFGTNGLRFSLEGRYQYQTGEKPGYQRFLVPVQFEPTNRVITSSPIRTDDGPWRRIILEFQ